MRKLFQTHLLICLLACFACTEFASNENKIKNESVVSDLPIDKEHINIFNLLLKMDSLLFEIGLNNCDTNQIKKLTSIDLEFYHDQAGITSTQESFVQSIKGLCSMDYKATREMDQKSLSVHLLKNRGNLYGAIQSGTHSFYAEQGKQPKYLTSTASFTHLWIIENENWKLKRALSFNHQAAEQ